MRNWLLSEAIKVSSVTLCVRYEVGFPFKMTAKTCERKKEARITPIWEESAHYFSIFRLSKKLLADFAKMENVNLMQRYYEPKLYHSSIYCWFSINLIFKVLNFNFWSNFSAICHIHGSLRHHGNINFLPHLCSRQCYLIEYNHKGKVLKNHLSWVEIKGGSFEFHRHWVPNDIEWNNTESNKSAMPNFVFSNLFSVEISWSWNLPPCISYWSGFWTQEILETIKLVGA